MPLTKLIFFKFFFVGLVFGFLFKAYALNIEGVS